MFSHLVMSDSLRPHGLQHARPPCPSLHFMVTPSNHLILCCPLLFLSSIFPSIKVYSNKLALHIRWPNYWSFSFSIIPSNEHSGLISFGIDWFYLLAVQGTLKSFLQHHCFQIKFENINYLALSLLYGPALTSIHDYWKNHSFDYIHFYWQSDISGFFLLLLLFFIEG